MPNSSRSNSSKRSATFKQVRKNSSQGSQPKRSRKFSSCSASRSKSKSVKSAQGNKASKPTRKNSSICNSSKGGSPKRQNNKKNVQNSSNGSAPKRSKPMNSSASGSPPRKMVKKNSSDQSKRSNGSPPRNNTFNNDNYNNRDNNDDNGFRGRGRGRGRGDFGGRGGRGDFGGRGRGNFGGNRNFDRDNNNNDGNNNNSYGGGNNNWNNNRNNNFNNNNNSSNGGGYQNNRFDNNNRNNDNNNRNRSISPHNRSNSPDSNKNRSPIIQKSHSQQSIKVQQPRKTPQQIRLQQFYTAHKQQGWFKQKYHPITLISKQNQRFLYIKKSQQEFLKLVGEGYFNDIDLSIEEYKSFGNLEFEENQDGEVDGSKCCDVLTVYLNDKMKMDGPPFYGLEKDISTLYIPDIPKNISRYDIYDVVSVIDGFNNLIISQPFRKADFKRMAWIQFQSQQKADHALALIKQSPSLHTIKQTKLQYTKSCKRMARIKIVNNYRTQLRLNEQLQRVIQVTLKLDYQAKIYQKNTLYMHSFKSLKQKLEIFLVYLRRVHFYEYFQAKFYDSYRTLSIKSGLALLIVQANDVSKGQEIQLDELKKLDAKNQLVKQNGSLQYRKKQAQYITIFTQIIKTHLYKVHNFTPMKTQTPKYWRCTECRKKFLTIDHLIKHTIARHEDWILDLIQQAQLKIYNKAEEEWEKNKGERVNKEQRMAVIRKKRFLIDFDDPQEEEQAEIKERLKPMSSSRKLINFLDI